MYTSRRLNELFLSSPLVRNLRVQGYFSEDDDWQEVSRTWFVSDFGKHALSMKNVFRLEFRTKGGTQFDTLPEIIQINKRQKLIVHAPDCTSDKSPYLLCGGKRDDKEEKEEKEEKGKEEEGVQMSQEHSKIRWRFCMVVVDYERLEVQSVLRDAAVVVGEGTSGVNENGEYRQLVSPIVIPFEFRIGSFHCSKKPFRFSVVCDQFNFETMTWDHYCVFLSPMFWVCKASKHGPSPTSMQTW
eukprot:TRINITY_DN735_c0_g4_i1.p1 TRINITY_DN735_c0_g4~~TRINITY_DN735_c0_g4_i1.p1  ORF type:complete len:242 (+),score=42.16 TRINITY_DN735_c0_g4_i1:1585-2310(+)